MYIVFRCELLMKFHDIDLIYVYMFFNNDQLIIKYAVSLNELEFKLPSLMYA